MGLESPESLTPPSSTVMSTGHRLDDDLETPDEIDPLPPAVTNPKPDLHKFVFTKRVGHYRLGQVLGEGSFAKVKEGRDTLTGEKVAVKVIDKTRARKDPYVSKNMRRESKLMSMVCHPNIVRLLEVVETDNSYYLVTEMAEGGDLLNHITSKGCLQEDETRRHIRQIVSAVDHIHKAGIIHRDLKIENLLLDVHYNIKIIDFGLSNTSNPLLGPPIEDHCRTQCGSPAYAAPELLGRKPYDHRVDIWSIGVNMYAMLTGNLPFTVERDNIEELHAKMLSCRINPIAQVLSGDCHDLLKRLLTAVPDKRITMRDIFAHPWLNKGLSEPFTPLPFPRFPTAEQLNARVLQYMCTELKMPLSDVTSAVCKNRAVQASACYHLLVNRLERYQRKQRAVKSSEASSSPPRPEHAPVSEAKHISRPESQQTKRSLARKTSHQQPCDELKQNSLNKGDRILVVNQTTDAAKRRRLPAIKVRTPNTEKPRSSNRKSTLSLQGIDSTSPSSEEEGDICMPMVVRPEKPPPSTYGQKTLRHSKTLGELGSVHIRSSKNTSSVASPTSPLSPPSFEDARTPTANDLQNGVAKAFGRRLSVGDLQRGPRLPSADTSRMTGTGGTGRSRRNSIEDAMKPWKQVKASRPGTFATGIKEVQRRVHQPRPLSQQEEEIQVFNLGNVQSNRARLPVKCNTFFPEATADEARQHSTAQSSVSPSPDAGTLPCIVPRAAMSAFRSSPVHHQAALNCRPFSTSSTLQPGFTILLDGFSELPPEQILLEVEKVLHSLQAENIDYCGSHSVQCTWQDVTVEISIVEHSDGLHALHIAQGSSVSSVQPRCRRVCQQIIDALRMAAC